MVMMMMVIFLFAFQIRIMQLMFEKLFFKSINGIDYISARFALLSRNINNEGIHWITLHNRTH